MKKKKYIVIMIFVMIFFTGCSYRKEISIEKKLRPPKVSQNIKEINSIIENKYGTVELVEVSIDERKNLLTLIDIDSDKDDDVLFFYKEDRSSELKGVLLKNTDTGYLVVEGINSVGCDVDSVQLVDLNNDNSLEILVSFCKDNGIDSALSIYDIKNDQPKKIFNDVIRESVVGDINQDGLLDLFIIRENHSDMNNLISQIEMYNYKNGKLKLVDLAKLENFIYDVEGQFGNVDKETKGIFLDIGIGAHSAFTEVIVFDNRLESLFYNKLTKVTDYTFKPSFVQSYDINGDGIIEIPLLVKSKGYEGFSYSQIPYVTVWNQITSDNKLKEISRTYDDYILNLSFTFPERWSDKVQVVTSMYDGPVEYVSFAYCEDTCEVILTIYIMDKESWKSQDNDKLFELGRTADQIYMVKINEGLIFEEMEMDYEEILNNFNIIER